jgi:hypothetical protein
MDRPPPPDQAKEAREASALPKQQTAHNGAIGAELAVALEGTNPSVGIRALTPLAGDTYLGAAVQASLDPRTETLEYGGTAEARSARASFFVGWGLRWGHFAPVLGPEIVVQLERGTAEGLPRKSTEHRAIWAGGLASVLRVELGGGAVLLASASAALSIPGLRGSFYVDDREILEAPPVLTSFGLGLGTRLPW